MFFSSHSLETLYGTQLHPIFYGTFTRMTSLTSHLQPANLEPFLFCQAGGWQFEEAQITFDSRQQ